VAIFDGAAFVPFSLAILAERIDPDSTATTFHAHGEDEVKKTFKRALTITSLKRNEWRVYAVIASRAHSRTKPDAHSAWITNRFIQEYADLRQSEVDAAVKGLVELGLVEVGKTSERALKRRYWLTRQNRDGKAERYTGEAVSTHAEKPMSVKDRRRLKGPSTKQADDTEDIGTSWDTDGERNGRAG
jgi:DNA-binding MarR family transcriptional regulator